MPRGHVLVVDDEPSILTTLQKALSLEGYTVDVAGGVRIAEEKLAKKSYDIALFDVALPDGDGVSLLEKVRVGGSDLPIVMMSGHASIDAAVRATRLGALDFLEKPLSTDRLLLVLDNTLRLVRAEAEARALRAQAGQLGELIGESRSMVALREQIARAAKASATVLVTGERGTGKELVARAIHIAGKRAKGPLEKMNCAAVPSELIESEMFGHEAGAFTGATKQRRGKFERASGGTLFLDEVGDMPLPMQAKLLRVLQEREIERVGGHETIKVDVRVVAATNRDLEAAGQKGEFRADLYDRLNVVPLALPPLRARREDVPLLARHFLGLAMAANDRPGMVLTEGAIEVLTGYGFPGNVRELRNLIERLVILTPDAKIDAEDVRVCLGGASAGTPTGLFRPGTPFRVLAEEAERRILEEALAHHGGAMAATARGLGLERSHLYKKCKALGLRGDKAEAEDEG
ncbi:sigma-54-dependent transcriptional regulator [Polyangium jinanense]|uniref:Sigma-54-dependent Fis family transcriptional regulator n=1 Tax=Polyangium jinanense TaxID=2829994 RepID=A0A9X3WYZ2_9BACT|nr:sigma-54 dependent transcriptional regulator [Polyangium jinanense]MDC3953546.1 sigma-54-dependent Fis family transcriptional regulator [Polyangium jinanense]MDC3979333.1 sigma-54-dependent Fis family transcriptional regulator [Polyangium jinanense]